MTCTAATFPGATAFERRGLRVANHRRVICRGIVIGLGAVATVAVVAGAVTVIAAWIVGVCFDPNPNLRTRTPIVLNTAATNTHYSLLAGAANLSGLAGISDDSADASADFAALTAPPVTLPPLPSSPPSNVSDPPPEPVKDANLPLPTAADGRGVSEQRRTAEAPAAPSVPPAATAAPPSPPASGPFSWLKKHFALREPRENPISLPAVDNRTAIYDIEAHTVYLPNGLKLEAHSGLGKRLDDPRYVSEKDRGPTPPNVYDLVLREEPFHGVRAIRLNPVGDAKMFGRDGILAHTYMLGPTGQSFGCVSFKNYAEFLKAFLKGEIDRLVVVPHLETKSAERGV